MLAADIDQVRALFIVRQICADALSHNHNQAAIIHVEPIRTPEKFVVGIAHERAVNVLGQVRLVEAGHGAVGSVVSLPWLPVQ